MSTPQPCDAIALFVGDGTVGKTCLISIVKGDPFPTDYLPTVLDNYVVEYKSDKRQYKIQVSDTSGQMDYQSLRKVAYTNAINQCKNVVVFICFALDSKTSFNNVGSVWLPEVKEYCKDASIVLVGTKVDARIENSPDHISTEVGSNFARIHCINKYIETSAKKGINVDQILPAIINSTKQNRKFKCLIL